MSYSHNNRTQVEIWAQKCIEARPQLLSKQIQGNGFTEEEAVEIADCALLSQQEAQAQQDTVGWIMLGIFGPIILALIVYGIYECCKANRECREAERQWQEAHKKHMEELDRLLAEANRVKAAEERKKKRGK